MVVSALTTEIDEVMLVLFLEASENVTFKGA